MYKDSVMCVECGLLDSQHCADLRKSNTGRCGMCNGLLKVVGAWDWYWDPDSMKGEIQFYRVGFSGSHGRVGYTSDDAICLTRYLNSR